MKIEKKFTKVDRGWYATADGTYAVVLDGYESSKSVSAEGDYDGFQGGEWGLVYDALGRLRENHNDGTNLDWFPTKRAAVDAAQRF